MSGDPGDCNTPVRRSSRARKPNSRFADDEVDGCYKKIVTGIASPEAPSVMPSPAGRTKKGKRKDSKSEEQADVKAEEADSVVGKDDVKSSKAEKTNNSKEQVVDKEGPQSEGNRQDVIPTSEPEVKLLINGLEAENQSEEGVENVKKTSSEMDKSSEEGRRTRSCIKKEVDTPGKDNKKRGGRRKSTLKTKQDEKVERDSGDTAVIEALTDGIKTQTGLQEPFVEEEEERQKKSLGGSRGDIDDANLDDKAGTSFSTEIVSNEVGNTNENLVQSICLGETNASGNNNTKNNEDNLPSEHDAKEDESKRAGSSYAVKENVSNKTETAIEDHSVPEDSDMASTQANVSFGTSSVGKISIHSTFPSVAVDDSAASAIGVVEQHSENIPLVVAESDQVCEPRSLPEVKLLTKDSSNSVEADKISLVSADENCLPTTDHEKQREEGKMEKEEGKMEKVAKTPRARKRGVLVEDGDAKDRDDQTPQRRRGRSSGQPLLEGLWPDKDSPAPRTPSGRGARSARGGKGGRGGKAKLGIRRLSESASSSEDHLESTEMMVDDSEAASGEEREKQKKRRENFSDEPDSSSKELRSSVVKCSGSPKMKKRRTSSVQEKDSVISDNEGLKRKISDESPQVEDTTPKRRRLFQEKDVTESEIANTETNIDKSGIEGKTSLGDTERNVIEANDNDGSDSVLVDQAKLEETCDESLVLKKKNIDSAESIVAVKQEDVCSASTGSNDNSKVETEVTPMSVLGSAESSGRTAKIKKTKKLSGMRITSFRILRSAGSSSEVPVNVTPVDICKKSKIKAERKSASSSDTEKTPVKETEDKTVVISKGDEDSKSSEDDKVKIPSEIKADIFGENEKYPKVKEDSDANVSLDESHLLLRNETKGSESTPNIVSKEEVVDKHEMPSKSGGSVLEGPKDLQQESHKMQETKQEIIDCKEPLPTTTAKKTDGPSMPVTGSSPSPLSEVVSSPSTTKPKKTLRNPANSVAALLMRLRCGKPDDDDDAEQNSEDTVAEEKEVKTLQNTSLGEPTVKCSSTSSVFKSEDNQKIGKKKLANNGTVPAVSKIESENNENLSAKNNENQKQISREEISNKVPPNIFDAKENKTTSAIDKVPSGETNDAILSIDTPKKKVSGANSDTKESNRSLHSAGVSTSATKVVSEDIPEDGIKADAVEEKEGKSNVDKDLLTKLDSESKKNNSNANQSPAASKKTVVDTESGSQGPKKMLRNPSSSVAAMLAFLRPGNKASPTSQPSQDAVNSENLKPVNAKPEYPRPVYGKPENQKPPGVKPEKKTLLPKPENQGPHNINPVSTIPPFLHPPLPPPPPPAKDSWKREGGVEHFSWEQFSKKMEEYKRWNTQVELSKIQLPPPPPAANSGNVKSERMMTGRPKEDSMGPTRGNDNSGMSLTQLLEMEGEELLKDTCDDANRHQTAVVEDQGRIGSSFSSWNAPKEENTAGKQRQNIYTNWNSPKDDVSVPNKNDGMKIRNPSASVAAALQALRLAGNPPPVGPWTKNNDDQVGGPAFSSGKSWGESMVKPETPQRRTWSRFDSNTNQFGGPTNSQSQSPIPKPTVKVGEKIMQIVPETEGNVINKENLEPKIEENKALNDEAAKLERKRQEWEAQERKNREIVDQRLKSFTHLIDNLYVVDRRKNKHKEVRRMICDCTPSKEELLREEEGCGDDCLNRLLMIECGARCPLKDNCTNKRFQKYQYANVEVFNAEEKGLGIRAREAIQPGTFIMEYVGEVFDTREFKRRRKEYARGSSAHFYFMALKSDLLIDATRKGNISRFINHSCNPNAETQKWTVNGELRIGFFATNAINPGEEINFDYRLERYGREPQKCFCGTPVCRGWLGESPDEKTKEEKDEERKKELRDRRKREEKRAFYEDIDLEDEIEKLNSHKLRNRQDTLNLCRLMVRAEDFSSRVMLLQLLQTGESACRRLFLDYHGLKVMWSLMADLSSDPQHAALKIEILKTLECLPVTNKTQLTDSKVLAVVERWSVQLPTATTKSPPPPPPPRTDVLSSEAEALKKTSDSSEDSDMEVDSKTLPSSVEGSSADDSSLDSEEAEHQPLILKPIAEGTRAEESSDSNLSDEKDTSGSDRPKRIGSAAVPGEDDSAVDNQKAEKEREAEELIQLQRTMVALALKLLDSWKNLKEFFRIPKKERIELMKEHEREVDRGYKEYLDRQQDKEKDRYSKWRKSPDREKEKPRQRMRADRESKDDRSTDSPKMSKEQRRQLFEIKVQQEEEEAKQRKMQEEMWTMHVDRCRLLGHDPYLTPIFDPTYQYYWDPNAANWQLYNGSDPNLPVPAAYGQPKPDGDGSPLTFLSQPLPGRLAPDGDPAIPGKGGSDDPLNPANIPLPGEIPQTSPSQPLPGQAVPVEGTPPQGAKVLSIPLPGEGLTTPGLSITLNHSSASLPITRSEESLTPPPPPGPITIRLHPRWKMARDSEGHVYFYHVKTRTSQWEPPTLEQAQQMEAELGTDSDSDSDSTDDSDSSSSSDSEDFSSEEEEEEETVVMVKSEVSDEKMIRRSRGKKRHSEALVQERVISTNQLYDHQQQLPITHPSTNQTQRCLNSLVCQKSQKWQDKLHINKSPILEIDREAARRERREAKERAKEEVRLERHDDDPVDADDTSDGTNWTSEAEWSEPADKHDRDKSDYEKVETEKVETGFFWLDRTDTIEKKPERVERHGKREKVKSKERAATAIADNSENARRIKDTFRSKIATFIVSVLNPYRRGDCKEGKITCTEDFKYLARKLTHFVMVKELKQLQSVEELECNDSVRYKTRDFVRKYMSKYGAIFRRDPNDTKEY